MMSDSYGASVGPGSRPSGQAATRLDGSRFDPSRVAEMLELADGLENAARVAWRWLSDDESTWEREFTLSMVERLSGAAKEIRDTYHDSDGSPKGGDACGSVHDSAGPKDIATPPSSEPTP